MKKGTEISHVCSHQGPEGAGYMGTVVQMGTLAAAIGTEHVVTGMCLLCHSGV